MWISSPIKPIFKAGFKHLNNCINHTFSDFSSTYCKLCLAEYNSVVKWNSFWFCCFVLYVILTAFYVYYLTCVCRI